MMHEIDEIWKKNKYELNFKLFTAEEQIFINCNMDLR